MPIRYETMKTHEFKEKLGIVNKQLLNEKVQKKYCFELVVATQDINIFF